MHRENSENDPMNAPQKTVFFKRSKPAEISHQKTIPSKDKVKKSDFSEVEQSNETQIELTSIDDEELDETGKKLIVINQQIEQAKKSHQITKQKLTFKAQSLKKAKATLTKTQKQLDETFANEFNKFEENRLEMIGKLSSKMAHDIRNPLTILQSQIELMKVKQKNHEDLVLTNSILNMEEAISNITNQITDVLGFIRTPELRIIACDLQEIIKNSINEVKFPTGIKLNSSLKTCVLRCDMVKIRGIITNIIQNAVQAIGVKGEVGEVNITLDEYTDFAIIKITDSGPGIPEKYLEEIFEPMFTTKDSGTGLGLATCRQFLEMHHGSIEVRNNPTTFTIKLPKNDL